MRWMRRRGIWRDADEAIDACWAATKALARETDALARETAALGHETEQLRLSTERLSRLR